MNGDELEQMRRNAIRFCLLAYQHVLDIGDAFGPYFERHASMAFALSRIVSEQNPAALADLPKSTILAEVIDIVEDQEDHVIAVSQIDDEVAVLAEPLITAHCGAFDRAVELLLEDMIGLGKVSGCTEEHVHDDVEGVTQNALQARMRSRWLRRRSQCTDYGRARLRVLLNRSSHHYHADHQLTASMIKA